MNVLQIAPVAPPYRAGMANAAAALAQATAAAGVQVTFVSAIGHDAIPGVTVPRLTSVRVPGAGFLSYTPALFSFIKKFDLIHLHYPCFGNAGIVHLSKLLGNKTPLITSYHMDVAGRGLRKPVFAVHQKFFAPRFLRHAEKIVVASRDYAEHSLFSKYPELMSKVVEIPFGIDTTRFNPITSFPTADVKGVMTVRAHHAIASDRPVILFVGGLDEQHYFKGLHLLMEALLGLPETKLLVVGSGGLLKTYARRAHALGVDERVIFAGRVLDADLPAYYRTADVFALPSLDRSEAYGLVLTEAAASGIPAVASDLPGVRTIVKHNETGLLVPPGDVVTLTKALKRLLSDVSLRQAFGAAARAFALSRTWEDAGKKYVEVYKNILRA